MATNENSFLHEVRDAFLEDHEQIAYWRKIHGSEFQAGMPDVVAASDEAVATVEFKWVKDEATAQAPLSSAVPHLLTALQRHELNLLAALDGPLRARVLIGMPVELPEGEAVLAVGLDVRDAKRLTDLSLVRVAEITLEGFKEYRMDYHLWNAQLRRRGERWRAKFLMFGMKRWTKKID